MSHDAKSFADSLGLPRNARIVIAHQDDVGMCHGANVAFTRLAGGGFITCGSVMVPCPWFREVVALAEADPDLDIGVHLTRTSEWPHYRWRPVSTASRASGLIDDEGYMWRRVPMLRRNLIAEAAAEELRAQIDAAMIAGLDITHIDTHMGAALVPELVDAYLALGREYRLPVLFPRHGDQYLSTLDIGEIDPGIYTRKLPDLEASGMPAIDHFALTPGVASRDRERAYKDLVRATPPGLSFLAFHCNAPGDIETIVPPRAHWRVDEYDLFRDAGFLAWVATQDIHLIGFRPIREWLRAL